MSAYDLHRDGDCWPDTCQWCAEECLCGEYYHECTCPTLPLDEDASPDQSFCDVNDCQRCSGYTEDEADPETCMCECHMEVTR